MPISLLGLTRTNDCAQNSDPSVAIRAIFIASLICVTVQHSKTENRGILPEMSNCYCHPGKAGGSPFWSRRHAVDRCVQEVCPGSSPKKIPPTVASISVRDRSLQHWVPTRRPNPIEAFDERGCRSACRAGRNRSFRRCHEPVAEHG